MSSLKPSCRLLLAAIGWQLVIAAQAAPVQPQPAVESPAAGAGPVIPEPALQRARATSRLVFSCIAPGLVTYSDRPCGPAAARRELKVLAPIVAGGQAPDPGKATPASVDNRRAAADKADATAARAAADRAEKCLRLEAALDDVDTQMRAGYPAREAGRLWERWRAARTSLREARC